MSTIICGIKSTDMCRENIWKDSQIMIPATWDLDDQQRKRAFTFTFLCNVRFYHKKYDFENNQFKA